MKHRMVVIKITAEDPKWLEGLPGRHTRKGVILQRKVYRSVLNLPKTLKHTIHFHIDWMGDGHTCLTYRKQVNGRKGVYESEYSLTLYPDGSCTCSCPSEQYRCYRQDIGDVCGEVCKHYAAWIAITNGNLEAAFLALYGQQAAGSGQQAAGSGQRAAGSGQQESPKIEPPVTVLKPAPEWTDEDWEQWTEIDDREMAYLQPI